MFRPEDQRKGARIAGTRLGPEGRSKRASIAAMARWGKQKPAKDRLLPPARLVWAWAQMHLADCQGSPGYAIQYGRLQELIEWCKQAGKAE